MRVAAEWSVLVRASGGESGGNACALRRWGNVATGVDSYGVGADRGLSQGAAHRGTKLRGRFAGPLDLGAGCHRGGMLEAQLVGRGRGGRDARASLPGRFRAEGVSVAVLGGSSVEVGLAP